MTTDQPQPLEGEALAAKLLAGGPHAMTYLKDDGTEGRGTVSSDGKKLTFTHDDGE